MWVNFCAITGIKVLKICYSVFSNVGARNTNSAAANKYGLDYVIQLRHTTWDMYLEEGPGIQVDPEEGVSRVWEDT